MKIVIESIPHKEQRYPTCGDWYYVDEPTTPAFGAPTEKVLHIRVSEMADPRHMEAVAIHELFEALACFHNGIDQEAVDVFDKTFEADREAGKHKPEDEPGDDRNAPYVTQHCLATAVERMYAAQVGIDWNTYADEVESL